MARILEITVHLSEIRWLLGMSSLQIVEHLLSGYKGNFPTFDGLRVIKKNDLIVCDLFRKRVQVARIKAVPVRFSCR